MSFFKKGQGISLNMIVIAAVVLIVLVVTVTIFIGRTGKTNQEFSSCENKGGTCHPWTICDKDLGWSPLPGTSCPALEDTGERQVCCIQGIV